MKSALDGQLLKLMMLTIANTGCAAAPATCVLFISAPHLNSSQLRCRCLITPSVNPLDCKGNHSATSDNVKLVHWPLMGVLLHLVQRGGDWGAQAPPRYTKCNSPPVKKEDTTTL